MIFLEVTRLLLCADNLPVQSCPCRFGKPLESAGFKLWWRLGMLHPLLCILMLSFLSKQPRSEWINPMVQSVVARARLPWGLIGFHPFNKKTRCVPGNGNPSDANRAGTLWIDMDAHAVCFSHHLFNYSLRPAAPPGFPCSVWNVRGTDAEAGLPIAGCITAALWRYNSLEEESDTTSRAQLTGNNIICHYSLTHLVLFHPWNTKCQFLTLFST